MKYEMIQFNGYNIQVISLNTVVVGTGAAGFNAADHLYGYGQKDIAIVTEHIDAGTSRNTGSDKQTYYKLSLSGSDPDSVGELAKTLFAGQCVDGDIALAEASLSALCFFKLVDLGVPFPANRYGEYVGYKTDHDPRRRATSVGPYTSKLMTEHLERAVQEKNIKIFDNLQVVSVVVNNGKFAGLLCLDLTKELDSKDCFVAFNCKNVIYATGGPAGMYANSVFPFGHYGASGIAFEAGVAGKNLTEWQFGLASVKPRWNVSGTYMQVLPKFVSTDINGGDEREFMYDFFKNEGEMLTKVFLKGYQWPFDIRKVDGGSSIIDILVYIETCIKGRRVFLDFRSNPGNKSVDFSSLSDEAREYLERAGAMFGTPIERLLHMNAPAVSFYADKGVDITTQPLEIALCVQHNNGGLSIDKWWQTNIEGFFAAGEVCGSHGVYRPGGSALNSGQVGSTRAAQYIAHNCKGEPASLADFETAAKASMAKTVGLKESTKAAQGNVSDIWKDAAERMSKVGGSIREQSAIECAIGEIRKQIQSFADLVRVSCGEELANAYRLYDALICQYVYLSAMADYIQNDGKSRGSALYYDKNGNLPYNSLPETFRYTIDDGARGNMVQEVLYQDGACEFTWRKVRAIPQDDDFFENVWRKYRENGNVY